MPIIYLSPSTQPYNLYVTGSGSEQDWMNRLADAMEPYLDASGIQYVRKSLAMTAGDAIRQSNAGDYDLHVALHSNAAPERLAGTLRGIQVFYYPGSTRGKAAAILIAEGLKDIYPLPNLVRAEPNTNIGEVSRVIVPSVFLEIGYHDNEEDARWIESNIEALARNIVLSITEYFGIPFLDPQPAQEGVVDVSWGYLNIREQPDPQAPVVAQAYDGARLEIINTYDNWYLVKLGNVEGYASADFINII